MPPSVSADPRPSTAGHAAGSAPKKPGPISLKPLMFETFVCTLAMMSFVALIGPLARAVGMATWQAGAAMTVGGIAWVWFSRIWGHKSDRRGRRRVLLQGLGGFVLSHAALCAFIVVALEYLPPVWLVFAGVLLLRAISGGYYAAVPATAGALVADHFSPEKRAGALATLGAASAAGMVAGPGFAGFLASYSLALPLYVTSVLPALALLMLWRFLPRNEVCTLAPDAVAQPLRLADSRLRRPLAVSLVAMGCVTIAQVAVGFFALDRLELGPAGAARISGIALVAVGVALILAQSVVPKLHWPPGRFIRIGAVVASLGFVTVVFAYSSWMLCAGYFIAAAGLGWLFPAVSALAANSVRGHEQGAAAGAIGTAHGLGMIIGPLIGTVAYDVDPGAPYALMALLMVLVAIWPLRRRQAAGAHGTSAPATGATPLAASPRDGASASGRDADNRQEGPVDATFADSIDANVAHPRQFASAEVSSTVTARSVTGGS